MLNIGKLAGVDSVDYYLSQVASGVEDYSPGPRSETKSRIGAVCRPGSPPTIDSREPAIDLDSGLS